MNEAFILKLIQAKRLEKEAFKELLPEEATKHTEVIEQELKAMVKELLGEGLKNGFDLYMKAKAECSWDCKTEPSSEEDKNDSANAANQNRNNSKKSSKVKAVVIE